MLIVQAQIQTSKLSLDHDIDRHLRGKMSILSRLVI